MYVFLELCLFGFISFSGLSFDFGLVYIVKEIIFFISNSNYKFDLISKVNEKKVMSVNFFFDLRVLVFIFVWVSRGLVCLRIKKWVLSFIFWVFKVFFIVKFGFFR